MVGPEVDYCGIGRSSHPGHQYAEEGRPSTLCGRPSSHIPPTFRHAAMHHMRTHACYRRRHDGSRFPGDTRAGHGEWTVYRNGLYERARYPWNHIGMRDESRPQRVDGLPQCAHRRSATAAECDCGALPNEPVRREWSGRKWIIAGSGALPTRATNTPRRVGRPPSVAGLHHTSHPRSDTPRCTTCGHTRATVVGTMGPDSRAVREPATESGRSTVTDYTNAPGIHGTTLACVTKAGHRGWTAYPNAHIGGRRRLRSVTAARCLTSRCAGNGRAGSGLLRDRALFPPGPPIRRGG